MGGMTPTQRTMKRLRELGYKPWIVEKFNRFGGPHGIRQDMYGIIDIVAIKPREILGVQSCGSAFAEHDRKLTQENFKDCIDWILAGGRLELWGWRKLKVKPRATSRRLVSKRGGKHTRWTPRIKKYSLGDFAGDPFDS